MGQTSSSSSTAEQVSPEQREAESIAASTGALPSLQKAFSLLSDPQTKSVPLTSLQKCFEFKLDKIISEKNAVPKDFQVLLRHLSCTIVDLFFAADKNGVGWVEFLRGYTKCCGRTVSSTSFNNLFRVFSTTFSKAGLPVRLTFDSCDEDYKISGSLLPSDVSMLLWICWIFTWDSWKLKLNMLTSGGDCSLPDITHLVLSAIDSCGEGAGSLDYWDCNVVDMDIQLPATEIQLWAMKTVPNLADCLVQFVNARLCYWATHEEKLESSCSSAQESSLATISNNNLLTFGRAWAISLTLRGPVYEETLKSCFPSDVDEINENLLYRYRALSDDIFKCASAVMVSRSSLHGRGLNRFWSNVEGYNGPLLLLIAASEDKSNTKKWIIGALTHQGFENKEIFYGSSGSLYAISPVFSVSLASAGKEKNFMYSHLHPTGRVYEPHPKPVGIAFGGSLGKERIFMDEDFARVTIRHHAVDKTYQHGSLFPNQGFLQVEASVLEVEAWGLGGRTAKQIQASYKKREELFTEQRRKVDLKTFTNWEDSPEKMMMDMMSNPNAVRQEDR